jgi:radical SAM superfamily enzyme YgiQ (UPF0313 family)/predicted SAM-dependent methyltransferase
MKIALIPPKCNYPHPEPNLEIIGQAFPYIAAALVAAGHEVIAVDINLHWCRSSSQMTLYERILEVKQQHQPDMYGVGGLSGNFSFVRDTIAIIRSIAPDKPIVCGGGIITYDLQYIFPLLRPDYAVIGEGEEVIVALLAALQSGTGLEQVSNIAYWLDGNPQYNQSIFSSRSLDDLPLPFYDPFNYLVAMDQGVHTNHILGHTRNMPRILPISMGRSCPYSCTFCCHSVGPKYRQRSIDNGLKEILHFYEAYEFNFLLVYDELFSATKGRLVEFSEKVINLKRKHGLDFDWSCGLRVNDVERETLKLMKESGCVLIGYGLESASQRVLDSMKKKTSVAQITAARVMTVQAGIAFQGNFIYGDVAETEETMTETWNYFTEYCRELIVHNVPVTPYPGSDIFEHCLQHGIIADKLEYYNSIGGIGQFRKNMSAVSDERFFYLLDRFLSITNRSNPNILDLPFGTISTLKPQGEFLLDLPLPPVNRRELVEFGVTCPHCGSIFAKTILLQHGQFTAEPHVRLYCANCHKRFLIEPLKTLTVGPDLTTAPDLSDLSTHRQEHATVVQPVAELMQGNYALFAGMAKVFGDVDGLAHYAASGLIGKCDYALAGLSSLPQAEEAVFYTGVIHWIAGNEKAALASLTQCKNNEHAQNLINLITKPRIEILAQLDRGSWSDLFDAVKKDPKFIINNIGFKNGDLLNRPYASIHDFYNPASPPDFYITKMLEWHLIPPDIQELPCPTFAQTADYDIHIQVIYPWLKVFDQLIIENEWQDVSQLSKTLVATYPQVYPLLKAAEQRPFPAVNRDIDVFISGTTFHPYHPDKAKLLNEILTLEGFNVYFVDGFLDTADYLNLLARTKICITYIRRPGMPTRGVEALAMGCAVMVQEDSALKLYFQEQQGVFTYNDDTLASVIRDILQEWDQLEPAIKTGAAIIRNEFTTQKVAAKYFRFLTYLAAKPRLNRTQNAKVELEQKRLILLRGWLQTPEVYKAIQQTEANNLDRRHEKHPDAGHIINITREMVLAYASTAHEAFAIEFKRIFGTSIPPDRSLLLEALRRYKEGIKQFPKALILRFNYIRTVLIFGTHEEMLHAIDLAKKATETPLSAWDVDPLHDVFPWDFFSQLFNYRRYFDLVIKHLKGGGAQNAELCRLVMASIHFHLSFFSDEMVHAGKATEFDQEFPFYGMRYAQLLSVKEDIASQVHAAEVLFNLAKNSMLAREAFQCLKNQSRKNLYAFKQCNILQKKFDLWDSRIIKAKNNYGDFSSLPFKYTGNQESRLIRVPQPNNATQHTLNILYIPLEFSTWRDAKYWSYTLSWGIEESLAKTGATCFTIPAIRGCSPDDPFSWLHYIKQLCKGKIFDQVWFTANHTPLDSSLLQWMGDQAPVRVGIFCESLCISDEEWQKNPTASTQRQEIVKRCLSVMTHAIVVDEADVNILSTNGVAAYWLPPSIPLSSITNADSTSPSGNQAVFYGALYGARKSFLEHPLLEPILIRPEQSIEEQTDIPARYDQLQSIIRGSLLTPAQRTEQTLQKYLEVHRSIRRSGFELWLKTISAAPVVVNLPQYGFMYSGRVAEAMAAGRPVVAAMIANRPQTSALFADGQDILLYDHNRPEQLAEKIKHLLTDGAYARQIALNAQQRLRDNCLIEAQVMSILAWINATAKSTPIGEQSFTSTSLRLHLGCGEQYLDGYTNIDYPRSEHAVMDVKADLYADITTLKFPDNSVEEIRLHHVFEHFNRVMAIALLIHWHEWLKTGGTLHIETPDLEGSAKIILSSAPWKIKAATIRHLAGDQADSWAYHIDHWSPERFHHVLPRFGFGIINIFTGNWTQEPYLANVTAIARKKREMSRSELVTAAEELLSESLVNATEQATYQTWKRQLHAILADDAIDCRQNLVHAGMVLRKSAEPLRPLVEIHDFNQRSRDQWVRVQAAKTPPGARILDVGAGTCPYRSIFSHCQYTSHDFKAYSGSEKLGGGSEYGQIDIESDICAIPVPDACYDVVLCTEVLEHVLEPLEAVREMVRILKPRGRLLLTAPLGSGLHQLPFHYYGGFTPEWYKTIATRYFLNVIEIIPNGGFFKVLAQECARVAWTFDSHKQLHGEKAKEIWHLFNELLPRYLYNLDDASYMDQFTVGYHVELIKQAPAL